MELHDQIGGGVYFPLLLIQLILFDETIERCDMLGHISVVLHAQMPEDVSLVDQLVQTLAFEALL